MTRDPSITPERLGDIPNTDFSVDELNLLRQWFHTMQDCLPGCLEQVDYDLAKRIYDRIGLPDNHPDRHPHRMTPH